MIKAWLLDEMFWWNRTHLTIDGTLGEWGAGDSIAAEEELPPPPAHVAAKSGNGRVTIIWDPVPDAMYYNLYFQTTKGVMIKFSDLTRPIAGHDDGPFENGVWRKCQRLGAPALASFAALRRASAASGFFWK